MPDSIHARLASLPIDEEAARRAREKVQRAWYLWTLDLSVRFPAAEAAEPGLRSGKFSERHPFVYAEWADRSIASVIPAETIPPPAPRTSLARKTACMFAALRARLTPARAPKTTEAQ